MGTSHEGTCKFAIIHRIIILRMRNVSDKSCREIQNTHFMLNDFFFFENCAVYVILTYLLTYSMEQSPS